MDALTAGVSLILVQLCVAVIMTGVYFAAPTEKATRYWALSGNIVALGVILAVLNRSNHYMLLTLISTSLIMTGFTFQWQGIRLFYKLVLRQRDWVISLVFTLAYLLLLIFNARAPYRGILFSGAALILFCLSLKTILQGQGRSARSFVQRLVRGAVILLVVSQVFRIIVLLPQLFGYLRAYHSTMDAFALYQVPLVGTVLFSTGLLLLYFERTIEENKHLATHDELSKLLNRRAIIEVSQRELELSKRLQRELTLAFIDIDFFKCFNDEFGHEAGDTVIYDISRIFEQTCRSIDVVGRYGGEEFLIVLPGVNQSDARQIGERLLAAVSTYRFRETHPVTISIGLATLNADDEDYSLEQLLQRADSAMYQAKQGGRNRCNA